MFGHGSGVIRLGDQTSHGGKVISGQDSFTSDGRPIAVVGDKVACPMDGHGECSIIEGHPTITWNGKPVAFHGHATSCGATLISSAIRAPGTTDSTAPSEPMARHSNPSSIGSRQPRQRNSLVDGSSNEVPCDHPDQALDLAAYIVDEIQKNSVLEVAQDMRRWNSYSAADEEAKWRDGLNDPSISPRDREYMSRTWPQAMPVGMPDFKQMEFTSRALALGKWAYMVRQYGDWDHKEKIARNGRFDSLGKSSHQWYHKYKEYEYYYDIWSNIHYGYLGVYCGFSVDAMLDGAGLEQVGTDILSFDKEVTDRSGINGPGLRKFDDSTDNLSIRIGFELFKEYPDPSAITAEIVIQKVVSAPYPVRNDSKILHDCDLARTRVT